MGILRRLDELSFGLPVEVSRVPDGAVMAATAAGPMRTRRHGDLMVVRLGDGEYAIALSPQALRWAGAAGGGEPFRVMLYRADAGRLAWSELRRVLVPQRRDALYKADLIEATIRA